MAGGLSDRVHRTRDDQIDAELSEFGARPAGVAVCAVARLQMAGADQARIDGERQRGVGETGMGADLLFAITLARQQPAEFAFARPVIFFDAVNADRLRCPLLVQPVGDRFLVFLVRAVIAEEDDVAETGELEAARGIFEDFVEGVFGDGNRAGNRICAVGGERPPSGT